MVAGDDDCCRDVSGMKCGDTIVKETQYQNLPDVVRFLLPEADDEIVCWPDGDALNEVEPEMVAAIVLFDPVGNRVVLRDAPDAAEVTDALVAESPIMPWDVFCEVKVVEVSLEAVSVLDMVVV